MSSKLRIAPPPETPQPATPLLTLEQLEILSSTSAPGEAPRVLFTGRQAAGEPGAVKAHLILGLGALVVLVSALADVLRIGGDPGFGYKQSVGVLVGIVLIVAGLVWTYRR